jgi:histidyl-tRNA synthetase
MAVNNVKGTRDIIGEEANAFNYIENLLKQICELFAYNEVRPPVLEHTELFVRSVGESSDVVRKEMYTFLDKAERSVTLRPEFTAGIMRLLVQNKLLSTNELPFKAYYVGPVFRYERPQLGRYRQFSQFGVEAVGNDSPEIDVETIVLAYTILTSLGLDNVSIKINTLGDDESRENYKKALKDYFAKYLDQMCPDCHSR